MSDNNAFISVVIPTRNRKDMLEKCLEAFREQSYPQNRFEIVVVDDGSTDGTEELLEEVSKSMANLRCLSQSPGGPAKARNLGIEKAKGPVILFTGDDCIADKKLLEEHNKSHRKNKCVAVLGHIDWHPDLEMSPFMKYLTIDMQFSFPRIAKTPNSVTFNFFYTSNISVEKSLLLNAGPFDEDFKDAVFEDVEIGYRLWKTGVGIIYNRKATTFHFHPVTLEGYIQRSIKRGRAAALLYKKHPELKKSDFIHLEDLTDPKVRHDFYSSVLRYYNALGLQQVLKDSDEVSPVKLIPLKDRLENWAKESLDALVKKILDHQQHIRELKEHIENQQNHIEELNEHIGNLQRTLDETYKKVDERDKLVEELNVKNMEKHYRIDELEKFELLVKSSLPFKAYFLLRKLVGKK